VVYLLFGHDGQAFANPHYRHLVANALRWAARR
jgi:type 1 glutamine amidotransferase